MLIASVLLALLLRAHHHAAAAAACSPPYQAQARPPATLVPPGQSTADFPSSLVVAPGEAVLLEGTARVTGGVTVRGTLFLSSTASSTLAADWVVVEAGGALVAGSEACPLPPGVTATILLRSGSVHPVAGRKALAVLAGGTIELYGAKGLDSSWARLAATAPAGARVLALDTRDTSSWAPGAWGVGGAGAWVNPGVGEGVQSVQERAYRGVFTRMGALLNACSGSRNSPPLQLCCAGDELAIASTDFHPLRHRQGYPAAHSLPALCCACAVLVLCRR